MKAVVMAGGEGTRLRPLTSNQPKPMVPIVGKPCMEHILELLKEHGFDDVVVTLAFMPQAIRGYFGDGEAQGLAVRYSVEESPAGTAGSVKLAEEALDEPFLVISGDALCDIDLGALLRFHREQGALVTIGLKSVPNPLEFGIVVTDEDGRVERFLEKPSWGQVFTDTINTGIYVLEPEVLRHVPTDRPYDFSKELFPLLLEMGKPLYGYVAEGYWQDIGNLDQYRQANFDALDGRVKLNIPGIRLRGNVWVGEGVDLDDLEAAEGPCFLGNYTRISPRASVGPYSVLMNSVTLGDHARTTRSVVDASTSIGRSANVEGAIVGRSCDIRPHVRLHEGVAVGDNCTIGEETVVMPGVRIYPFKEVEAGALVDRNLIWEARLASSLIGADGISGRINVDLTPETALRIGIALGTALERGDRIVTSRAASTACRLIRRALLAGLNSAGVHAADLQVMPAAVNRHFLKTEGFDAGIHVQPSPSDPEVVQVRIFEPPGTPAGPALVKEIDKHFSRQEFRRAAWNEVGEITFSARTAEAYVQDLLATLDVAAIRSRGFRIVVDYAFSAASLVLPQVLGALDVEAVATHGYVSERRQAPETPSREEALEQAARLVEAVGADLGAVLDPAAERLFLVDDLGREVPVEQELLLFLRLLASDGKRGRLALPTTVTSRADDLLEGTGLQVLRTQHSLSALTLAAAGDGVIFAGSAGGGFVFPEFVPAYDGMASLCKLLELLAPSRRTLSEIAGELPQSAVVHREVRCPWARKGAVMRIVTERMKGREVDLSDGIKVFDERGWAQVLPDPDEPLVHVYAEGRTEEEGAMLEAEFLGLVEEIVAWEDEAEET
ncbi:MAG TPA: sugar phosphate nucleotidyltransferase [Gaiellaceae bacterium]|nr:sugar phosphate nucleotidyltransferase [Gaiellaceae bacterium]